MKEPASTERAERYRAFDRWHGRYLDWQIEQFTPYLGMRILEIGCGIGGISERFPPDSYVHSLDVEEDILLLARDRFPNRGRDQFQLLDISECGEEDLSPLKTMRFDTIVCINVLEHIRNDVVAVRRMEQILDTGGRLLILVPAHEWLYGEYDRLDGHYRRYNKKSLRALVSRTGLHVDRLYYFNCAGALGWWWHYKVLRRRIHGESQFSLMSKLIGPLRFLENCIRPLFGLSLIAVLTKK